ncbi:MAG: hypothetical protein HY223_05995 [Thaumarchaeota archaeon]|nr:hypothetical protein [Nitrososphaerota archaeon]
MKSKINKIPTMSHKEAKRSKNMLWWLQKGNDSVYVYFLNNEPVEGIK